MTLKNAALVYGPCQWEASALRVGQIGFTARRVRTERAATAWPSRLHKGSSHHDLLKRVIPLCPRVRPFGGRAGRPFEWAAGRQSRSPRPGRVPRRSRVPGPTGSTTATRPAPTDGRSRSGGGRTAWGSAWWTDTANAFLWTPRATAGHRATCSSASLSESQLQGPNAVDTKNDFVAVNIQVFTTI